MERITEGAGGVRARLVRSGQALFARRGFAGTSLRAAAEGAGVTSGSIQYHFGDKKAFYETVVRESVAALDEAWREAGGPGPRSRVSGLVDHLWVHPDTARLLIREVFREDLGRRSDDSLLDRLVRDLAREAPPSDSLEREGCLVGSAWALEVVLVAAVSAVLHPWLPGISREGVVGSLASSARCSGSNGTKAGGLVV